jgi:predicted GH43/DUF377 family glycosyl hydrolase
MNNRLVALIFLVLIMMNGAAVSQTQWTKYSSHPVLSMDTTYMWAAYGEPACVIQNDTFKMGYVVASGVNPSDTVMRGRIHYAWSLDGITWNKFTGNPVLDVGGTGAWDGQWLDTPEILKIPSGYNLYYYGDSTYQQGQSHTNIGLATSPDGIHFTKQGKVLFKGAPGDWDGKYIESPAAYYDPSSGVYALWYTGQDTVGWINIGLAVSNNGVNWNKYPGPVLTHGAPYTWDDMFAAVPSVIRTNGVLEMWYSGISFLGQQDSVRVGYAVSFDGAHWIKYPGNPVLFNLPGDTSRYWAVDVVWDSVGNQYKMYYENYFKWGAEAIYLATSPRNVLFSASCNVTISRDTAIHSGDTIQLYASGGTSYRWYPEQGLSNPDISNPLAFPDTNVTYTVLVVSDLCITTDTVKITVTPLSVHDPSISCKIKIFPNPATDWLTLMWNNNANENANVYIYDITGQLLLHKEINSSIMDIDVHNLSKGLYLIALNDTKYITKKKFIKE